MDVLAIIIMIIIVLGLVGVISYFVYVYLQDKDSLTAQINSTNITVANEQSNRLSNIKYVVDQVNTVNSDIATQFSSNLNIHNTKFTGLNKSVTRLQSNVNTNTQNINSINTGFGQYIKFGNPQETNGYNLLNLPSSSPTSGSIPSLADTIMTRIFSGSIFL